MGRMVLIAALVLVGGCGSKKKGGADDGESPNADTEAAPVALDAAVALGAADPPPFEVGPCGPGALATPAGHGPSAPQGSGRGAPAQPKPPLKPEPRIGVGVPKVEGGLEVDVARRYLAAYSSRLQFCYKRAVANGSSFAGTIDVRLEVDAAGKVSGAALSGLDDETELSTCFASALRSRAFPEPEGGSAVVSVKMALRLPPPARADKPARTPPPDPAPPDVSARYDSEGAFRALASNAEALSACLAPVRAADPRARGTFAIGLSVDAAGTAGAVVVDGAPDDTARSCLAEAVAAVGFPAHELGATPSLTCYFAYGAAAAADARAGAPIIEATPGGASAALIEPGGLVVVRATPDATYDALYRAVSDARDSGARYIALDVRTAADWEPAYTPPVPQARYYGAPIARDPLSIHIAVDAIRVRGAKKIRARDGVHDFAAVASEIEALVSKPTYAHRTDVAVQADSDVPYSTVIRVIQDAVRHGLTQVDLVAPNR